MNWERAFLRLALLVLATSYTLCPNLNTKTSPSNVSITQRGKRTRARDFLFRSVGNNAVEPT